MAPGESILLSAAVSEAGLPVTDCTVAVRVESPSGRITHLKLDDDGEHDDGDAKDAEYAAEFRRTGEAGSYEFLFRTVGYSRDHEPVVREASRAKFVRGRATTPRERKRPRTHAAKRE